MALEILQIPVLQDNYNYVLHDSGSGETVCVDPSLAAPVVFLLEEKGWRLTAIWSTHHHNDHVGGNAELQAITGCDVYGYEGDAHRIPGITRPVKQGDSVVIGSYRADILFLPGHTLGHIAYYLSEAGVLFSGDVIFGCGCGRLFEGMPQQMYESLGKIMSLPDETRIYCGHEYTEANGRFAVTVEPGNVHLQQRMAAVQELRRQGIPTAPLTLAEEKSTNPFLRPSSGEIRNRLHMQDADDVAVFGEIRRLKDIF